MDIALLNVRITFQKNTVSVDAIGNHSAVWQDFYSCYATLGGETRSNTEQSAAGTVVDHGDASFTVRYCEALKGVSTTAYRILFLDELYDIIAIDHMNFKKKCLKFYCKKVRR